MVARCLSALIATVVFSTMVAVHAANPPPYLPAYAPTYEWTLPVGFPEPVVPLDNPMTAEKVALGDALFHDPRLSSSAELSCASCHKDDRYFTDGLAVSLGALGEPLEFNTPTLLNAAYSASFSWVDKGFLSLEEQHRGPLFNQSPLELGLSARQLKMLSADDRLVSLLIAAFPAAREFSEETVIASIASYVRTLIRGGSDFDRYLFDDDKDALSPEAQRGLSLFSSARLNCASCHRGFLLSGPTRSVRAQFEPSFYRTGVSGSRQNFRSPSLRFINHTAPYMHDGSMQTLDEVLAFYAAGGGRKGGLDKNASERIRPFELSGTEKAALLAFLNSL